MGRIYELLLCIGEAKEMVGYFAGDWLETGQADGRLEST